jgi:hypothetical protein
MRRLWFAVVATLAAASALTGGAKPAQASCLAVVVWHDTAYFGLDSLEQTPGARQGGPLSGAVVPDCADTGGPPGSPHDTHAAAIRGVSPEVAIVSGGEVFVATGYLPYLPGFPLHHRGAEAPRTCTAGPPVGIDGTAETGIFGVSVRRTTGGLQGLSVDAHTRIVDMHRHGLPFIGAGQHVHAEATRCGTKLVARRITAAGPIVGQASATRVLGDDWDGVSTPLIHSYVFWIAGLLLAAAAGAWALHRRLG